MIDGLNLDKIEDFTKAIPAEYDEKGNVSVDFLKRRYDQIQDNNKKIETKLANLQYQGQLELEKIKNILPEFIELIPDVEEKGYLKEILTKSSISEEELDIMINIVNKFANKVEEEVMKELRIIK